MRRTSCPNSTRPFLAAHDKLLRQGEQNSIIRPAVANTDLGAISWLKDFNIIDMARLGSPILSRLEAEADIKNYFFEMAVPDLVELHDIWSARFAYLTMDERFGRMYEPVETEWTPFLEQVAAKYQHIPGFREHVRSGIWIRRDMKKDSPSRERAFHDRMRREASLTTVRAELEAYAREKPSVSPAYIERTIYRFLPEIVQRGEYDALLELLAANRAAVPLEASRISGRKNTRWVEECMQSIAELGKMRR